MISFTRHTYVERRPKESSNDRNDRAIRQATRWYEDHLDKVSVKVVLLTNDKENRKLALADDLTCFTGNITCLYIFSVFYIHECFQEREFNYDSHFLSKKDIIFLLLCTYGFF